MPRYCVDFEFTKTEKAPVLQSVIYHYQSEKPALTYSGLLPDNDSDGQDELLNNKYYVRLSFEFENEQDFLNNWQSKFLNHQENEFQQLETRMDCGRTKADIYYEFHF